MKDKKMNDNRYLSDLNLDNATDEQKIALLNRIIDNELEKPEDEVDMTLVDECMAFIADLEGNRFQKTDDELTVGLQKIMFGHRSTDTTAHVSRKTLGIKQFTKFASILVAAVLSLVAVFAIAAKFTFGDDAIDNPPLTSPDPQKRDDIIVMLDGIETASYSSVEQLLQGENLSIHYLSKLPQNVWLDSVNLNRYDNNQIDVTFHFNSASLQFNVCSYELSQGGNEDGTQLAKLEIGAYSFMLHELPDQAYQATCTIGEYVYRITCTDYNDLLFMLNHLKASNAS